MTPTFPITREKIRNHFHYFWWQYALLIVGSIFLWNLLYTVTHYRSPEHLKVEWYYDGPAVMETQELADRLLAEIHPLVFPEMEEVTFTIVGTDVTYGDMQMVVWMSARQGDLYMLTRDHFEQHAAGFVDLAPYVADGTLHTEGIDLKKGYVKNEDTGEKVLCGIPADSLKGLEAYGIFPEDTFLSILANGGNTENTLKLMNYLLDHMQEALSQ